MMFIIIWGVVCRIPWLPGVPMRKRRPASSQTCTGDTHISFFFDGPMALGLFGSRSNQFMKLLSAMPVPGTTMAEPKPLPRLCVTATALPSASMTSKWVVHSVFMNPCGSPGVTSFSSFCSV